ncbi:MAG TPA: hypothetical protein VGG25_19075 [Streptosporangiaceae bacterium]|jgi:hypothetical protein
MPRNETGSDDAGQPVGARQPVILTDADMDAAAASGQAIPLGQVITFIMRYQDRWWLSTHIGWLPVPASLVPTLDRESERIRAQDAHVTRQVAIRSLIALARHASGQAPREQASD